MMLLLGEQRIRRTRADGTSGYLRHDFSLYLTAVDQTIGQTIRWFLTDNNFQLTGLLGCLPTLNQLRRGGVQVPEHYKQLIEQSPQHVEQQYQRERDDVEIAFVHRRLRAVQEAVMVVVKVIVVVVAAAVDRRRGFIAVLALGHAQLLGRLRAEFSCRTCAITVRHLPRVFTLASV